VAPDPVAQLQGINGSTSGTLGGDIPAGLYVVYVYREVTTQDPVSSSLQGSINWTHNGKAMTRSLANFHLRHRRTRAARRRGRSGHHLTRRRRQRDQ
jgi:hypothetical protein